MELVRARIKGTQDVVELEKYVGKNRVMYYGAGGMVFTADEVEEQGPYEGHYNEPQPQPQQKDDPLAQLPQEMVQMVTDMVNGYIDRFDAMYWQRQRVEIVKTLMNRLDLTTNDPTTICNLADQYIQMLKNYE